MATINGKGGHGAHPDKTIDTFYLTAHVILALNAIVSRRLDPFAPAVVSIGSINGGFTENVIPESVRITGTLRFADPDVHTKSRMKYDAPLRSPKPSAETMIWNSKSVACL